MSTYPAPGYAEVISDAAIMRLPTAGPALTALIADIEALAQSQDVTRAEIHQALQWMDRNDLFSAQAVSRILSMELEFLNEEGDVDDTLPAYDTLAFAVQRVCTAFHADTTTADEEGLYLTFSYQGYDDWGGSEVDEYYFNVENMYELTPAAKRFAWLNIQRKWYTR